LYQDSIMIVRRW